MSMTLALIRLPYIGDVNLSTPITIIFILCLLAVVGFEFVNGFHDTANAVATVIYTKALKPMVAVPWSGAFNFLGVLAGGVAVAMGILKLLPLNEIMALPVTVGACFVLAVLLASIVWNLGTWYLGIPCSSSHTLIGAMIGAGLAFTLYYGGAGVNWSKAGEIGMSLILSPLFGFGAAVLLMFFLKNVLKANSLFHVPQGENDRPPILIRLLLITTCTLVSFFHGSNDGQKGVGLLMLILIAFLPASFAIDRNVNDATLLSYVNNSEQVIQRTLSAHPGDANFMSLDSSVTNLRTQIEHKSAAGNTAVFGIRKQIQKVAKQTAAAVTASNSPLSADDKATLSKAGKDMNKTTEYAPIWAIATISISLGIGTMIGWKRIVVTIGEKIGKEHLNYAQGATAEIVAASTIGLSTWFGLPVSTTHVLSSGIAGAMVASKGSGNLNNGTLRNIAMAWILTLPISLGLAFGLFALFHLFV